MPALQVVRTSFLGSRPRLSKQPPPPPPGAHQMSKHPRRPSGSQSGREKRREESFHVRAKEPLGADNHRTISKTSSGCRLLIGHKHALYYCAQSSNSFSLVLFVRSYTTEIVSPPFLSFTKLVAARETFIFYFPNQKRRNYL